MKIPFRRRPTPTRGRAVSPVCDVRERAAYAEFVASNLPPLLLSLTAKEAREAWAA